ncbi:MAG: MerR family transcriptional regulator [Spirochaetaceae bacterium]|nr:MerR family transcriptional regulator [Spirochaetaceae bacterium]MBQ8561207.1 MerR family transcriptional regulator [Spirochaetaceae bacterium]MBR2462458.1 MerR family transcriptional regulator [Spirochaetaceae bacterium]
MPYSIGEISQRLGIAPSALRYYEKEGLLPFVERSDSGVRQFTDIDLEWLIIIDSLKKTGMPLKKIKEFVTMFEEGDSTSQRRLEIIAQHREIVKKQVEELNEILQALDFKEEYYNKLLKRGNSKSPQSLSMEDLPPEMQSIRKRVRGD